MMKLLVGTQDLTEIVEKIIWSGDTKQVARKLSFTIAYKETDYHLPKVVISSGDQVTLSDDVGNIIFGGIIFDIDKSGSGNTITYLSFDFLFFINNSDISRVFESTPEEITKLVCKELEVPIGNIAETGIALYMPCFGKKAYEVIMMAYTAAAIQNGKKYIPIIENISNLSVIEKGTYCGVVMEGTYNVTESSYKTTLQGLINKVLITDSKGAVIKIMEDKETLKYGIVQKVYKQEEGKNAEIEAKALFQGLEESGNISGISDIRAVSGYGIAIQESISGLYGLFYIESDTHTFENGKATMQLTLAFSNMMDEKEIEKPDTK